jgi:peptidoglycan/LPS O-acetylase OafA/YrhL
MKHNKSADGLRGIASLNVAISHFVAAFVPTLLNHNYPTLFPENLNPGIIFKILQSPIVTLAFNGHFAVFTFFILSGFVLTIPYFNDNTESLRRRLWGRYLRLNIPVATSIAISLLIYKLGWYHNLEVEHEVNAGKWLSTSMPRSLSLTASLKSALFDSILFGQSSLNPPMWTLRIEFLGSIYLLVLYLCTPKGRLVFTTAIAAILLDLIYKQDSIYFMAILAGALLNLVKPGRKIAILCFALGIYFGSFQYKMLFYDFLPRIHYWERKDFYNALGALFLTVGIIGGVGRNFLESRPIQFLGKHSFSMYLIHFIILCSLTTSIYLSLEKTNLNTIINFGIYINCCYIVAVILTKFIDKPAIKISHRFTSWLFSRHPEIEL